MLETMFSRSARSGVQVFWTSWTWWGVNLVIGWGRSSFFLTIIQIGYNILQNDYGASKTGFYLRFLAIPAFIARNPFIQADLAWAVKPLPNSSWRTPMITVANSCLIKELDYNKKCTFLWKPIWNLYRRSQYKIWRQTSNMGMVTPRGTWAAPSSWISWDTSSTLFMDCTMTFKPAKMV